MDLHLSLLTFIPSSLDGLCVRCKGYNNNDNANANDNKKGQPLKAEKQMNGEKTVPEG